MSTSAPQPQPETPTAASAKSHPGAASCEPSTHGAKTANVIPVNFGAERPNVSKKMSAQEREFLPAALQIIETPVSPTKRVTALVLCSLIAIAIGWAYFARVDMVAVAPGEIVPKGQVKVIQPLETAAIKAIYVNDGAHVKAGQVLVDLDATDIETELKSYLYDQGQAALDAEVARLLLTRDPDAAFHAPASVDPALAETNHQEAVNEIRKYRAQIDGIDSQIAQQKAVLVATNTTIDRDQQTLPLLNEKYQAVLTLYDKRDGPRPPVLDADQALIEKKAELESAQASILQTEAQIKSLESNREQTTAGYLVDAANQRTTALQKLVLLKEEIARDRRREYYRRLRAPVDGTVQTLKIHTLGAVVTAADTLMTIVPDDAGIEVDAQVQNMDIGFVHEGQPVQIKLDAFPFTRYGLVKGTVRELGRDSVAPSNNIPPASSDPTNATAQPAPASLTYPARIRLAQTYLLVDGVKKPLEPGMQVSAEIKTGTRRVLQYLLSPVLQAAREAGRER